MLRTLTPTEPQLVKLCRAKTWVAVAQRSESHPEEAVPTELAAGGAGTTALAIAVRSSAPIGVIQSLIEANSHQLAVFHKFSGSIMHEALKHRESYNVLRLLLQAMIHHERVHHGHDDNYLCLLGRQDNLGRTVLHHMVNRALHEIGRDGDRSGMWVLFRSIVLAYPPAVQIMDADGNTPLLLALLVPGFINIIQNESDEAYIHRMVKLMVITWPSAATIGRKVKHQWKQQPNDVGDESPSTIGDGAPNPLSYAILYGRSQDTIQVLFDAHNKVGVNACLTLVSGYREVPLHLAASLRSSVSLLSKLLQSVPASIRVHDMYHLTPLDWIWIRHAVDWCSADTPFANIMPSTRRYLSPHFTGWHCRTTKEMKVGSVSTTSVASTRLVQSLLDRMRICLPAAARVTTTEPVYKQGEPWSLLHSACSISCPLAMVRLAYEEEPTMLSTRDLRAGRLPLHYAAARLGYRATVPVGVSREVRTILEPSPALEIASMYKIATRIVDAHNQLPLHIAIDTAKQRHADDGVVTELVYLYPGALERRDGKSMLYPYLQAAAGEGTSLDLVYTLLREHPTLVMSSIPKEMEF